MESVITTAVKKIGLNEVSDNYSCKEKSNYNPIEKIDIQKLHKTKWKKDKVKVHLTNEK